MIDFGIEHIGSSTLLTFLMVNISLVLRPSDNVLTVSYCFPGTHLELV